MKNLKRLFDQNREWAEAINNEDPTFFEGLSKAQDPDYLWIGCSDSRVPANQIVNLPPGDVFVHRNIANVVVHTDLNCLSVIHFAVEVLKVKHIIVCGHYDCGGIKAALDRHDHGLIDYWLLHIKDVARMNAAELAGLDEQGTINRLCELNVAEQVANVCDTSIIRNAWAAGDELSVHGWIYGIEDGLLQDLGICITSPEDRKEMMKDG